MRLALMPHPDHPAEAVSRVEVEVTREEPDALALRYVVHGRTSGLLIPPPAAPDRTDGLWQHSCFELFLRRPGEAGYREFNFSPSSQWAAYAFAAYRADMAAAEAGNPQIETRSAPDRYELHARLTGLPPETSLQLGLSAVIEEQDGRKSYWALAHGPGKADFHDPASFVCELP